VELLQVATDLTVLGIVRNALCTPTGHAEKDLVGQGDAVAGSYIVVLKDGATASPQTKYNGKLKRTYSTTLNGFSVRDMTEPQARRLAADPKVAYVQRNLRVSIQETQRNPVWGLDRIDQRALPLNANYVYPDNAANNVRAYVLDTGILTTHQEFEGRASHGFDFIDDDPVAEDCHGHGTHFAGTVAGRSGRGSGDQPVDRGRVHLRAGGGQLRP